MGGTVPKNYPPLANMEIGERITGSSTGNTATLAGTVFFTAPTTGLYLIAAQIRIIATDGTGSLAATLTPANTQPIESNSDVALKNADLSVPADGYSPSIPIWMNSGNTVSCGVIAAGLVATEYDVYVTAERVL